MDWIPVAGPWVTEKEVRYTADAAANGWYANHSVYPDRFEKGFAKYLGVAHATSLPSCTSALHLALAGLGIGAGDEVIVPDATWIATSAPVSYVGATPVFADMDKNSWCLDAAAFESAITPRTKAVIVVHLYGNMADIGAITDVARRHGIAMIEDAAEAIGSEYRGRKAGAFGDAATFSFHGSKTLTTGEGGMLVTSRDDLFARVLRLRDHGREPGDRLFFNQEIAYKYKMSALQAAFGLAQLERIEELVSTQARNLLMVCAAFQWHQWRCTQSRGANDEEHVLDGDCRFRSRVGVAQGRRDCRAAAPQHQFQTVLQPAELAAGVSSSRRCGALERAQSDQLRHWRARG